MSIGKMINEKIASHGHMVISSNDGMHSFAYTIGLTEKGLPELAIFGVNAQHAAVFLNHAAALMTKNGEFKDDDLTTDLAENMPVGFKVFSAEAGKDIVCQAIFHYEGKPAKPRFLQMVVPDREGRLPGQDGFDLAYMGRFQPHLWERTQ